MEALEHVGQVFDRDANARVCDFDKHLYLVADRRIVSLARVNLSIFEQIQRLDAIAFIPTISISS
jgi:hypothetical protein